MLSKVHFKIMLSVVLLIVFCSTVMAAGPAKKVKVPSLKAVEVQVDPFARLKTKIASARAKTKAVQAALKKGKLLAENAGKEVDNLIASVQGLLAEVDKDSAVQKSINDIAAFYDERQKKAKSNFNSGEGNKKYWNESLKDWQAKSARLVELRSELDALIKGIQGKIDWMKQRKPIVVDLYLRNLAKKVNSAIAEMVAEFHSVDKELDKWASKFEKINKMPR